MVQRRTLSAIVGKGNQRARYGWGPKPKTAVHGLAVFPDDAVRGRVRAQGVLGFVCTARTPNKLPLVRIRVLVLPCLTAPATPLSTNYLELCPWKPTPDDQGGETTLSPH